MAPIGNFESVLYKALVMLCLLYTFIGEISWTSAPRALVLWFLLVSYGLSGYVSWSPSDRKLPGRDLSASSGDILEGPKSKPKLVKVCKYFPMLIMIGSGSWEGEGISVF